MSKSHSHSSILFMTFTLIHTLIYSQSDLIVSIFCWKNAVIEPFSGEKSFSEIFFCPDTWTLSKGNNLMCEA